MKTAITKLIYLLLAVTLCFSVIACTPTQKPDATLAINVSVLNGTTGFGIAPLMQSAADGEAALNYQFSVETDATVITSGLVQGSIDIAALPTNAASVVYNRTNGGVQLLAINTLGVLYLLDNGNGITSFADLAGKTVAVPAQNPTFIFTYLCEQNGLTVGEDIFINNSFSSPAELQANVAAGTVTLAVLPEPMVTITTSANSAVTVALDLTEEWNRVSPEGSLAQGCIVVRTEFAAQHPAEVAAFLEEYRSSVQLVIDQPTEAGVMIQAQGIFAKAPVAAKAIPNCNLCILTGAEMKAAMSAFLNVMYEVQPKSIGDAIPADDFYYISGK